MNKNASIETGIYQSATVKLLTDDKTNNTDIISLDQQVKSMMIFSNNADLYKGKQVRARICKVCGKEGSMINIMNHIESNHINGISVPCNLCGKSFTSRNTLASHKFRKHRNGPRVTL